jgi:Raf kinase inhibitor-like YbhB/YbcL family protein
VANDPSWRLPEAPSFELTSPDFADGAALPEWARSGIAGAGGQDISPQLSWSGAPAQTRSYAVTCFDPDAPTSSGWWHWAVHGLSAGVDGLARNAGDPAAGLMPAGAVTLPNDLRLARFLGAAPPAGHGPHRYFFTVTALDVESLDVPPDATPAVLGFQMAGHVVARAHIIGTSETS